MECWFRWPLKWADGHYVAFYHPPTERNFFPSTVSFRCLHHDTLKVTGERRKSSKVRGRQGGWGSANLWHLQDQQSQGINFIWHEIAWKVAIRKLHCSSLPASTLFTVRGRNWNWNLRFLLASNWNRRRNELYSRSFAPHFLAIQSGWLLNRAQISTIIKFSNINEQRVESWQGECIDESQSALLCFLNALFDW